MRSPHRIQHDTYADGESESLPSRRSRTRRGAKTRQPAYRRRKRAECRAATTQAGFCRCEKKPKLVAAVTFQELLMRSQERLDRGKLIIPLRLIACCWPPVISRYDQDVKKSEWWLPPFGEIKHQIQRRSRCCNLQGCPAVASDRVDPVSPRDRLAVSIVQATAIRCHTFTRSDFGSYIGLRLGSAATRTPATSIS